MHSHTWILLRIVAVDNLDRRCDVHVRNLEQVGILREEVHEKAALAPEIKDDQVPADDSGLDHKIVWLVADEIGGIKRVASSANFDAGESLDDGVVVPRFLPVVSARIRSKRGSELLLAHAHTHTCTRPYNTYWRTEISMVVAGLMFLDDHTNLILSVREKVVCTRVTPITWTLGMCTAAEVEDTSHLPGLPHDTAWTAPQSGRR